jgi:hypothetical protein
LHIKKSITFALTNLENALFFKHIIFAFVGVLSNKEKSANFPQTFGKLSVTPCNPHGCGERESLGLIHQILLNL